MVSQVPGYFGVVFTIVALIVRFAGNRAVLAGSAQCGIKDFSRLNVWAGNRLFLLPIIAFGIAWAGANDNATVILGGLFLLFSTFGVILWISIGSKQFK